MLKNQCSKPIAGRMSIDAVVARIDQIVVGGGHAGFGSSSGYDCSGFVSAVLPAGGFLSPPVDTTALPNPSALSLGRGVGCRRGAPTPLAQLRPAPAGPAPPPAPRHRRA